MAASVLDAKVESSDDFVVDSAEDDDGAVEASLLDATEVLGTADEEAVPDEAATAVPALDPQPANSTATAANAPIEMLFFMGLPFAARERR